MTHVIDQPSELVFPHISNHPDDQPPGLVAVGPSQPGGWTRFHSPLHRRRRSDQSLVKAGSRLPSTDSPSQAPLSFDSAVPLCSPLTAPDCAGKHL